MAANTLPPPAMMTIVGSPDEAHFRATMCDLFGELVQRGSIERTDTILDLGCGCGRLAIPFAAHLDGGVYFGVDVWPEGLDWCRENITAARERYGSFREKPLTTSICRGTGSGVTNHYHLAELHREQVDFAFAISLFTHLQKQDCISYFAELARVLKRDGCAYLTCFIIDEFFFDYVRRTGLHQSVSQEEQGCYYAYQGQDFFAGYPRNLAPDARG